MVEIHTTGCEHATTARIRCGHVLGRCLGCCWPRCHCCLQAQCWSPPAAGAWSPPAAGARSPVSWSAEMACFQPAPCLLTWLVRECRNDKCGEAQEKSWEPKMPCRTCLHSLCAMSSSLSHLLPACLLVCYIPRAAWTQPRLHAYPSASFGYSSSSSSSSRDPRNHSATMEGVMTSIHDEYKSGTAQSILTKDSNSNGPTTTTAKQPPGNNST